jgi:hypothetical protein
VSTVLFLDTLKIYTLPVERLGYKAETLRRLVEKRSVLRNPETFTGRWAVEFAKGNW